MPSLYEVETLDTGYAADLNQLIQILTGVADAGELGLFSQISAPTALTAALGTSGSLTGAYTYKVTYVTGLVGGDGALHVAGETTVGTVSSTVNPSSQRINLTNIPVGPAGTISRKIYRTKAGGSTYYLLTTISDNITTSWTDNTVDGSIVTTAPTTNTTGSLFSGLLKLKTMTTTQRDSIVAQEGMVIRNTTTGNTEEYKNGSWQIIGGIMAGLDASKPAAGIASRIYVATDTRKIYEDTGAAWIVVANAYATLFTCTSDPVSPAVGDEWLRTDL